MVEITDKRVVVSDPVEEAAAIDGPWRREFHFDASFDGASDSQEEVFRQLGIPMLKQAWAGYDVSFLAYGQTGSGKTHSAQGDSSSSPGLIPRICDGLFEAIEGSGDDVSVEASYMEIYNESVRDLLLPTGKTLRVREHPRKGAHVPELTTVRVSSREEIAALVDVGTRSRATAATKANARSSRSHSVFTLAVSRRRAQPFSRRQSRYGWWCDNAEEKGDDNENTLIRAKIRLVDLAGSERVSTTGTDGVRLREAKSINKSLATLCDVIEALGANSAALRDEESSLSVEEDSLSVMSRPSSASFVRYGGGSLESQSAAGHTQQKGRFVPYRNSTLTWLLKDSLGGKSAVTMLACVSPSEMHYEETLATLKYAERARRVRTRPKRGTEEVDDSTLLFDQRAAMPPRPLETPPPQPWLLPPSTKTTWPNLTNLNPDPEFAGRRVWSLYNGGVAVVGSGPAATVKLRGAEVRPKHALIAAVNAQDPSSRFVVLVALPTATVHVDGTALDTADRCDALVLRHGSRVVFAGLHAFRFEERRDDDREQVDATEEWHAAQRELDGDEEATVDRFKADLRRLTPDSRAKIFEDYLGDDEPPILPTTQQKSRTNLVPNDDRPIVTSYRPPAAATPSPKVLVEDHDRDLASTRLRMDIAQAQLDAILGTGPSTRS